MNFIFISPNFPEIYSHFVKRLHDNGVNVLAIGDSPFDSLNDELKTNLTEYCYVSDMNRLDWMENTVQYFIDKYGEIDYLESNNEYWMRNDSKLREKFNIKNGYRPNELEVYQSKSGMKKFFQMAGVKTGRYILATTYENSVDFVNKVGFPIFAKPDSGVGAADTFKICSFDELKAFHERHFSEQYIIEEFIDGTIVSFDGIANSNSDVVIAFKETFPTPIAEIVNNDLDLYYFAESKMPKDYREIGEKIIKAFQVKSRCFHCELFKLNSDKPGFAKKGEIVALEINLRSPGGYTPDLLNLVSKNDYYKCYADMITKDVSNLDNETNYVAYSINRKNSASYKHSVNEIMDAYSSHLKEHGYYPPLFRNAMGDEYFLFLLEKNKKIEDEFLDFVLAKN